MFRLHMELMQKCFLLLMLNEPSAKLNTRLVQGLVGLAILRLLQSGFEERTGGIQSPCPLPKTNYNGLILSQNRICRPPPQP